MRKIFIPLMTVAVVAALLLGCMPGAPVTPPPVTPPPVTPPPVTPPPVEPPPVEPVEPLKIGYSWSATGWGTMYEVAIYDIMLAYQDKVNEEGGIHGRPIELIVYDNESTSELAVLHAKKFIEEDEVLVIISELFSGPAWAQCEVAKGTGVPFIVMVGGPVPPEVFIPGENIFNNHLPYDYFQDATVGYFAEDLGVTRMAILATTDESGEEDLEYTLDSAEKFGIEVVIVERCDPEALDVTAQLARIKAADVEAIHLAGSGVIVGPMMKGIKLMGLDTLPVAGTPGMVSREAFELVRGYEPELLVMTCTPVIANVFPGVLPPDHPIVVENDEMWDVWYEAYGDTHGTREEILFSYGFFGWDVMEIAIEGLRQAGPLPDDLAEAREAVRWAMENKIIGLQTTSGIRNYSPTDKSGLTLLLPALITIEDGEVVLLKLLQ
ncbi:hypothetical protein ES704_02387 [subsurface metagenome]